MHGVRLNTPNLYSNDNMMPVVRGLQLFAVLFLSFSSATTVCLMVSANELAHALPQHE